MVETNDNLEQLLEQEQKEAEAQAAALNKEAESILASVNGGMGVSESEEEEEDDKRRNQKKNKGGFFRRFFALEEGNLLIHFEVSLC